MQDINKVQINYTIRRNNKGEVMDKSTMVNIRCDSAAEALELYGDLKRRLNGELSGHKTLHNAHGDEECPECGVGHLIERRSKKGPFLGCSGFPDCRYTRTV